MQEKSTNDILSRHIIDSLQLREHVDYANDVIFDIGSGAGFPGLILAIDGAKNINLVEPIGKKAVFLNHIKNLYNLNVIVHACTWQQLKILDSTAVLSRAYTNLDSLLKAMTHVSRETIDAKGFFLKGEKLDDEIKDAQKNWLFRHEIYQSITHKSGKIIKVWEVSKK